MAYSDWMPEFQELYNELPVDELYGYQRNLAEYLFEEGFMRYSDEVMPGDIAFARQQFFDLIGPEWEDYFDWDYWLELMYG